MTRYAAGPANIPPMGRSAGSRILWGNPRWDCGIAKPFNGALNRVGAQPYAENATTLGLCDCGPAHSCSTSILTTDDSEPLPQWPLEPSGAPRRYR